MFFAAVGSHPPLHPSMLTSSSTQSYNTRRANSVLVNQITFYFIMQIKNIFILFPMLEWLQRGLQKEATPLKSLLRTYKIKFWKHETLFVAQCCGF